MPGGRVRITTLPQSAAIADALEQLGSDEPSQRLEARRRLVAYGNDARPALDAALQSIDSLTDPVSQEITRIRDWIDFGVDPQQLGDWFQELDLRARPHRNMFGGMLSDIESHPAFGRIVENGPRIQPFLDAAATDASQAYSLRAAAVLIIHRLRLVASVAALFAAYREELRQFKELPEVKDGSQEFVPIQQPYRGLFLYTLHSSIIELTGEPFTAALIEDTAQVRERGMPGTIYVPGVAEEALRRWEVWFARSQSAGRAVQPDHDLDFLLTNAPPTDAMLDATERVLRGAATFRLGTVERTTQLFAAVLSRAKHPVIIRDLLHRAAEQNPTALFRALPEVINSHPQANDNSLALFNPYAFLMWSPSVPADHMQDDTLDAVVAGLASDAPRTRALFLNIASTLREGRKQDDVRGRLLERLKRSEKFFEARSQRVEWLSLRNALGEKPPLSKVLKLAAGSLKNRDAHSLSLLLEMLGSLDCPLECRERAVDLLFQTANAEPDLSVSVLRALSQVDKEHFTFNPAMGPKGIAGLIALHRLSSGPGESIDRTRVAEILQKIREDLMRRLQPGSIQSVFIGQGLDICIRTAERFDLPDTLYNCLLAKTQALGIGARVTSERADTASDNTSDIFEQPYFKSLGDITTYTSYDVSAALAGWAADVALRHGMSPDQIFMAQALQADMARKAGRFEQSGALFQSLAAAFSNHPDKMLKIRHFETLLLLQQRRWADALDVTLATPIPAGNLTDWSPEQRHFALDARLYEALCCRRLGQISRSFAILNELAPGYIDIQSGLHYAQVEIELAIIQAQVGNHNLATQSFAYLRDQLDHRPGQEMSFAHALGAEAEWRIRTGKVDGVENVLTRAIAVQEAAYDHPFEGFDTRADNLWRLGQVLIAQGKTTKAAEPLVQLQKQAPYDPISGAYAARLLSSLQMFEGALPSAIVTLQQALQLLDRPVYPELKIDLCLDLQRILLASGFPQEAERVLGRALPLATAARDPVQVGRVLLAEANVFEEDGDIAAARQIYAAVAATQLEENNPGDACIAAWVASSLLNYDEDPALSREPVRALADQLDRIWDPTIRLEHLCGYVRFCISHKMQDAVAPAMKRIDNQVKAGVPLNILLEVVQLRGMAADLLGHPEQARTNYQRAVHLAEVMHSASVESGAIGSGFLRSIVSPYRSLVENLVAANETREALHFVERAKARFFLEQIHWQETAKLARGGAIQNYLRLLRQLAILEAGTAGAGEEVQKLQRELADLKQQIGDESVALALFPVLGDANETWTKLVELLREHASDTLQSGEGMLLVEYFTTEDATYVFGVREDWTAPKVATVHAPLAGMRSYAAANFSLEEPQADGVRATTQSKVSSLNLQEWQRRFGPFIDPILSWAEPGDYVYLVPHDVLHYLPLHALMAGGVALMERNPVLYAPSASILRICRTKRKGSRKTILILADSEATRPLPHARAEALQIAGLFGTHPYLGELATKSLVRRELDDERNTIDILHFACHGSFHPEQALKSGILVAPEPNAPQTVDTAMLDGLPATRFLTAEEFFQLDMNTDHVTLSACESGVNQLQPGDELFGLMRALMYAGTPSLLMSLWSVDDISTGILMQKFYEALGNSATKAKAVQAAATAVKRMTAANAIAFCRQSVQRLEESDNAQAARRIRRDIGELYYQARDYAAARATFEALMNDTDLPMEELASLDAAITRCDRLAALGAQPDPAIPVFDHPFWWAPFVLIGDCK